MGVDWTSWLYETTTGAQQRSRSSTARRQFDAREAGERAQDRSGCRVMPARPGNAQTLQTLPFLELRPFQT